MPAGEQGHHQRGSTVPILRPVEFRNISRPPIPSSTVPVRRPCLSRIISLLPMPGSMVPVRRPLASRRISRFPIPGSIVPVRRPEASRWINLSPIPCSTVLTRRPSPSRTMKSWAEAASASSARASVTATAAKSLRPTIFLSRNFCVVRRRGGHHPLALGNSALGSRGILVGVGGTPTRAGAALHVVSEQCFVGLESPVLSGRLIGATRGVAVDRAGDDRRGLGQGCDIPRRPL